MSGITQQDIDKHYESALDSVNLIKSEKRDDASNDEWNSTLSRNAEHLKIVVARDYFSESHDMRPLIEAIELAENALKP